MLKLKLILRRAYGFRNLQNMTDMIMLCCSDLEVVLQETMLGPILLLDKCVLYKRGYLLHTSPLEEPKKPTTHRRGAGFFP